MKGFKTNKSFTIPLIELDEMGKKVPILDKLQAKIVLSSKELKMAIEDCDVSGESAIFWIKNGKFIITSEGDINKTEIIFSSDIRPEIKQDNFYCKFSIEYLKRMMAVAISENVTIEFAKEYTLQMEFANEGTKLKYILAPRIDSD